MARKYVILTASEVTSIDFSKVCETSADTLRWNNDKTKTFVKWDGEETPSFLDGKTQYSNAEILEILDDEWSDGDGT